MRNTRLLLVPAALALVGLPCLGGTISMQITCGFDGTNLSVSVVNHGDEAARNVLSEVVFMGREYRSKSQDQLAPGQPMTAVFQVAAQAGQGTFPAVATVHFEDLNGYPFSSVTVHPVRLGQAEVAKLFGVLEGGKLRKKARLSLRIRNQADEAISARCRVVVARELVVPEPETEISVPGRGTRQVKILVENFSALPTSTYPVHVLIEYDQDGHHFCAMAVADVAIEQALPFTSWGFWLLLAIFIAATGVALTRGSKK